MLAPGLQLGPYEIRGLLGRGGMAEVYRARDDRLGRELALKVLPPDAVAEPAAVERFIREARAASALNHPNVITIYEIGETQSGRFIAMELVEGSALRSLIGAPSSVEQLSRVGAQIAGALAAAHAAGIIHRDVKPENIMLRTDGYVKVLDFGVARLLTPQGGSSDPDSAVTAAGTAVGTLRYMSPEQACAEPITSATDVFSLGMVLFELATGQHPFAATSDVAVVRALLTAPTPNPSRLNPAVPPVLDTLIARMLEKEASRRPAAAEVESVLLELARGRLTHEPPHTAATPDRRTVGRDRDRRELRRAFEEAAGGRGVLINVAGEPGIGKTTIVEEFLSELSAGSRSTRIARGQCSERLAGTEAYLPLLEALDSLMASPARELVTAALKRLGPTWYLQIAPATTHTSPEGRALANVQASSQERMKRELVAFFDELSRATPLVLFFDDLQWADVSTIDVLGYVASRISSLRLLIVVTVRQAELLLSKHPFAQLKLDLQARGLCREVVLDFLTAEDVAQFLALEFPGHEFPSTFAAQHPIALRVAPPGLEPGLS